MISKINNFFLNNKTINKLKIRKRKIRNISATEGRISLRESLRIFRKIEIFLSNNLEKTFESLCQQNSKHYLINDQINCGNTMKCFISLLISDEQINNNEINNIISGSPFSEIFSNPSILLYSLRKNFMLPISNKLGLTTTLNDHLKFSNLSQKICSYTSNYKCNQIQSILMTADLPTNLPRILFCSMVWITPNLNHTLCDNNDNQNNNVTDIGKYIKDHMFTIIKHNNNSFQLIQGYIELNDMDISKEQEQGLLKSGKSSPAFGLSAWQNKHDLSKLLDNYSNRNGFDKIQMYSFILYLFKFSNDSKFDANSHQKMFDVLLINGEKYWPSLNYSELTDNFIIGNGERNISNNLETYIDNY